MSQGEGFLRGTRRDVPFDETLLEVGLQLTPAQRLQWLEEKVEELLPWLGLAQQSSPADAPPSAES